MDLLGKLITPSATYARVRLFANDEAVAAFIEEPKTKQAVMVDRGVPITFVKRVTAREPHRITLTTDEGEVTWDIWPRGGCACGSPLKALRLETALAVNV